MAPDAGPDPEFGAHARLLGEANAFAASLTEFDRVSQGLDVGAALRSKALRQGQSAVRRVVEVYGDVADADRYYADRRMFDRERPAAPTSWLGDVVWTIATTLLDGPRAKGVDLDAAVRLAVGRDPVSTAFGLALAGRFSDLPPDPGDPGDPRPPVPGRDRIPFDELEQIGCFVGLRDALDRVGRAAAQLGRSKPYPGMAVTRLDPASGCAPGTIRVIGQGFQARQPADAVVVFGSVRAEVVAGTWSDGEFTVRIPEGVAECCVSVLQAPPAATGGGGSLAAATSDLAGVLATCFGAAASVAAGRLETLSRHAPDAEQATCKPDGSNRFVGGPPIIRFLQTAAGSAPQQRMLPGQPLELEWSIVNARSAALRITAKPGTSPLAVVPSLPPWFVADPAGGRTAVATMPGLVPWSVDIELRAENACGSDRETLEIRYDPAPGLVFVGGGMRSSFDLGAIEALGALLASRPAVCAGSGMGGLSAVCAAADYPNPSSLRTFWDSATDSTDWYRLQPALANPGDFAAVSNARWQAQARAEVLTMDALGLLRRFMVPPKPADDREEERIIANIATGKADEWANQVDAAVSAALQEAGQSALSSIPIFAIVWAAAKFGIAALDNALRQQTANLLATLPAIFDDTALRGLLTTATAGIQQRVQTSGRSVRIPLTSLEKGRALYGLEAGGVSEAPIGSQIRATAGLAAIVQASATVPFLGAPKAIGTDAFVDGALRDPVPIGAAIEAGAGTVIVVQPHIRLMAEEPAFSAAGAPRIDARTSTVRDQQSLDGAVEAFGRFARDPVTKAPVGSWRVPVFVVEPTVDLVGLGASVGQAGLVTIMSDYGYLRAYDALTPWLLFPREQQRAERDRMLRELADSTDAIVGLRVTAWDLEHRLNAWRATPFGPDARVGTTLVAAPEQSAIAAIRATKRDIRTAIVDRLAIPGRFEARAAPAVAAGTLTASPVPRPRAETWVQAWEKHSFHPLVAPATVTPAQPDGDPWVSLTYAGVWTEPAATRPPPIWGP